MPITYSANGQIEQIDADTHAEARLLIKELRLKKKEWQVKKNEISAQMAEIRARARDAIARNSPLKHAPGSLGKMMRTLDKVGDSATRSQANNALRPLEARKRDIDSTMAEIDRYVLELDRYILSGVE